MASVVKRPNGHRWVQFKGLDGSRKTLRLGKVDDKHAQDVRRHVEELIAAKLIDCPVRQGTAVWVSELPAKLHQRLAATGIVLPRAGQAAETSADTDATKLSEVAEFEPCKPGENDLEKLAKAASSGRLASVLQYRLALKKGKPSTLAKYENTQANLLAHFGEDREISTITEGDAEEFRFFLLTNGGRQRDGQPLAETTANKRLALAREFFEVAVKKRWLKENPFDGVRVSNPMQIDREFHLEADLTWQIIDAIEDDEFRLLFAFARFGGLRCNSETGLLRWSWIDWASDTMTFRSPKTEHLPGRGWRTIPLFAELRPFVEEVWARVKPGDSDLIFETLHDRTSQALANRLSRVCRRIGVELWPKPWVNVRGTREQELVEHYPIKTACKWIGNDEATAKRHYLRVTKDHVARAASGGAGAGRPQPVRKQTRSTKSVTKQSDS